MKPDIPGQKAAQQRTHSKTWRSSLEPAQRAKRRGVRALLRRFGSLE